MDELHLSGRRLAEHLRTREGTVSNWKTGKARPEEGGNLEALAAALQVKPADLLADGDTVTDTAHYAVIAEPTPPSYALGVLEGQAQAVRQFLEAALTEQDALIRGIRRMAGPDTFNKE